MNALIDGLIEYIVKNLWENLLFWRIAATVLFVSFALAFAFRNHILRLLQRNAVRVSDKAKFTESDQILNEGDLTDFIDMLGTDRYYLGQTMKAKRLVFFSRKSAINT